MFPIPLLHLWAGVSNSKMRANFGIIATFHIFLFHFARAQSDACSNIDLALLVDASTSTYSKWYAPNGVLQFTRKFVDRFNIGENNVRVSIMEFADYGYILYRFANVQNKTTINNEILPTLQIRSNYETRYEFAFQMCYQEQFTIRNGERKTAKNIAVLITDGSDSPDKRYDRFEAKKLISSGIELHIFGYGNIDTQFMLDLVQGDTSKLRIFETHEDLTLAVDTLYEEMCPTDRGINTNINQFPRPGEPGLAFAIPAVSGAQDLSPSRDCSTLDVAVLIDASGSAYGEWYAQNGVLQFTRQFIDKFNVGTDNVRISIQDFADRGYILYRFSNYQDKNAINSQILPTLQIRNNYETRYEYAFQTCYREQFTAGNGERDYAENVAVLITDGSYYPDKSYARYEARQLNSSGIDLYIFGYGNVDRQFMIDMLLGDSSKLRLFDTHEALTAAVDSLYRLICPLPIPRNPNINQLPRPGDPAFAFDIAAGPVGQGVPSAGTGCTSVDACFLIDTTFRILSEWYGPRGTKEFLKKLLRKFTDKPATRTCAQLLTDDTKSLWRLYSNLRIDYMDAIFRDNIPYSATSINGYINSMAKISSEQFTFGNGDRPSSPNILIIVASNYVQSSATPELLQEVRKLQSKGIRTFVISWGGPNRSLLLDLVGGASSQVFVTTGNQMPFGNLDVIYNSICNMI